MELKEGVVRFSLSSNLSLTFCRRKLRGGGGGRGGGLLLEVMRKQRKDDKRGAERIKQYKRNENTPLSPFMQLQVCVCVCVHTQVSHERSRSWWRVTRQVSALITAAAIGVTQSVTHDL